MHLSIVMPSLWEFRIREWSGVPTLSVRAPYLGFGVGDKAFVKGGMMQASKDCWSDFEAGLVGRFGKGVHA